MPSNLNLFRRHNYNPIFVETGSYVGDGIKNAIFAGFESIHSIELADKHYNYCKALFKYNNAVQLHHGDSVDVLPKILSNLTQPATFWLDAHYSGGDTTFQGSLTPLMRELELIKNHPIKTHTILIDDLREWSRDLPAIGFGLEDIKKKILEINPDYSFSFADGHTSNDILVADTRRTLPINIVVFSKDRAMQLELFLRSFNNYVKDANRYGVQVLYTTSNDEFQKGYNKFFGQLTTKLWIRKEQNFKKDLLNLINQNNPYTIFFVDDDFFKNSFDFFDAQMDIFDWDQRIACRSLRLDRDMRYCYTTQKPMLEPIFYANNVFNWKLSQEDFGYPMSLDGHIFRTAEILPMLQELDYQNPNTLEGQMVHRRNELGELMICYNNSIIMNNPINKVQTVNNNLHGNIGAKELNDLFLEGNIIDMAGFGGIKNMSAHQELPLTFIKP
jgi:hypothetical protein